MLSPIARRSHHQHCPGERGYKFVILWSGRRLPRLRIIGFTFGATCSDLDATCRLEVRPLNECNPSASSGAPMWIVKLALRRPYTFVVLALLLLIIGPL